MSEVDNEKLKKLRMLEYELEYRKQEAESRVLEHEKFLDTVRGGNLKNYFMEERLRQLFNQTSPITATPLKQEKKFHTETPIQITEDYYYQGTDFWHMHNVYPPYPGSDGKISYDVCNVCHTKSPKEVTDKLKFILTSLKTD